MKYTWIIATLFLMGCKSTPTFCEINPDSKLCDSSDYSANTREGLDKFEHYRNQKAFALAKSSNGAEITGYSYGYKSRQLAKERALMECQKRVKNFKVKATCEIIR